MGQVMALISEMLERGATYSFEFFPPKDDAEQATLVRTLRELEPLAPSFVSVTYRGGRESRQRTHDLVAGMLRTTTLTPMAHLVCVAHTRLELVEIVASFRRAGVENLMALGGDPPTDPSAGVGELAHAVELVRLAREIGMPSIGVAAHPAGHPASPDMQSDRDTLAAKLRLADFGVTQFFWEAQEYAGLIQDMADRGVHTPILPGIMPVTALRSVPRMAQMGAALPDWAVDRLEEASRHGGEDAVRRAGVAMATELCERLLEEGAPGLHFYTLNRSSATREIYAALGLSAPA
jgi:methylenetetrahydrofolate reductase (NADPH)